MHARVLQFRIKPGKTEEFQQAIESVLPKRREEKGYCGLLVLRGGAEAPRDGWIIALWETLDDLRASEKGITYYGALSKMMGTCEGMPSIVEQEVLLSDFKTV